MSRIVFAKHMSFSRVFKQGWALRHEYPDIKLTLLTTKILHSPALFERIFDEIIYTGKNEALIAKWVRENEASVYHVYDDGSQHVPTAVMKNAKVPVVYDANDMSALYHGDDLPMERYCMENADGFCLKFPESAIDWYKENGYDIKGKYLEYIDYCIPDLHRTGWPVDRHIHLTHCGVTGGLGQGKRGYNNQHIHWLLPIVNQGYYFHLYVSPWIGVPPEYIQLEQQTNRFTAHKGLQMPQIQEAICGYHYGCMIHDFRHSDKIPVFWETAMSHKSTTYWEAGLPVIVSANLKWAKELMVDRWNVGFAVDFDKEMKNFGEIEAQADYEAIKKSVLEKRENELNAYKQVHRLVDFYKDIGAKL